MKWRLVAEVSANIAVAILVLVTLYYSIRTANAFSSKTDIKLFADLQFQVVLVGLLTLGWLGSVYLRLSDNKKEREKKF